MAELSKAMRDVIEERQRQVTAEGWTPEHDDAHANGEMARAAGCYAMEQLDDDYNDCFKAEWIEHDAEGHPDSKWRWVPHKWPWHPRWWKPKNRRRNLVRAAALILAEIERLDRTTAKTPEGETE